MNVTPLVACAAYVKFNYALGKYVPRCPCGWRGEPSTLKFSARIEARHHNEAGA